VVQTIFNEPLNGSDFTAQNAMIDLLRQASPGSEVHIAIYEWDSIPYAEAVEFAVSRGVTVRVVADGNEMDPAVEQRLVAAIGRGNVTLCGRGACIGTGINHNKFMLFSRLDDGSSNVVMQGSHNFRDSQNRRFNHLVVVRGDNALYTHYRDYWNDLRGQGQNLNYYDVHGDFTGDTGVKGYFFPRVSGDLIISVLNNVHCDPGAELHVGMAFFKDARGVEVARTLREKRDAGCGVHIIVGNYLGDDPPSPSQAVQDMLRGMDWRIYDQGGVTVHSKYLLIRARYATGDEVETLVFAGSHNYTNGALRSNDEALLRLNDAASYNAFLAHWNRMRAALP
jgi:phosphatidylserine/phosphatidylglycerophosphate/cardiolipin synthase-like enzyme